MSDTKRNDNQNTFISSWQNAITSMSFEDLILVEFTTKNNGTFRKMFPKSAQSIEKSARCNLCETASMTSGSIYGHIKGKKHMIKSEDIKDIKHPTINIKNVKVDKAKETKNINQPKLVINPFSTKPKEQQSSSVENTSRDVVADKKKLREIMPKMEVVDLLLIEYRFINTDWAKLFTEKDNSHIVCNMCKSIPFPNLSSIRQHITERSHQTNINLSKGLYHPEHAPIKEGLDVQISITKTENQQKVSNDGDNKKVVNEKKDEEIKSKNTLEISSTTSKSSSGSTSETSVSSALPRPIKEEANKKEPDAKTLSNKLQRSMVDLSLAQLYKIEYCKVLNGDWNIMFKKCNTKVNCTLCKVIIINDLKQHITGRKHQIALNSCPLLYHPELANTKGAKCTTEQKSPQKLTIKDAVIELKRKSVPSTILNQQQQKIVTKKEENETKQQEIQEKQQQEIQVKQEQENQTKQQRENQTEQQENQLKQPSKETEIEKKIIDENVDESSSGSSNIIASKEQRKKNRNARVNEGTIVCTIELEDSPEREIKKEKTDEIVVDNKIEKSKETENQSESESVEKQSPSSVKQSTSPSEPKSVSNEKQSSSSTKKESISSTEKESTSSTEKQSSSSTKKESASSTEKVSTPSTEKESTSSTKTQSSSSSSEKPRSIETIATKTKNQSFSLKILTPSELSKNKSNQQPLKVITPTTNQSNLTKSSESSKESDRVNRFSTTTAKNQQQSQSFAHKQFPPPMNEPIEGLIGIEYVIKIKEHSNDTSPRFECALCEVETDGPGMQWHVKGLHHRVKFLQRHFPTVMREFQRFQNDSKMSAVMAQIAEKLAQVIEKHHGRDLPYECLRSSYCLNRREIMSKVYSFKHATEYSGPTFLHVIDKKTLDEFVAKRHLYKNPPVDPKRKITFDTRNNDSTHINKRPRIDNDSSSHSNQRLNIDVGPKLDNEEHKRLVEQFLENTNRGRRSRSPHRSSRHRSREHRSRSRSKDHHKYSKRVHNSPVREGDVWQIYRRRFDRAVEDLEKDYERYRKDPERHPSYEKEWKQFWIKKTDELVAEGRDTTNYDYQADWVRFFIKRIDELYEEDVEQIRLKLRVKLNLDFENDKLQDERYHVGVDRFNKSQQLQMQQDLHHQQQQQQQNTFGYNQQNQGMNMGQQQQQRLIHEEPPQAQKMHYMQQTQQMQQMYQVPPASTIPLQLPGQHLPQVSSVVQYPISQQPNQPPRFELPYFELRNSNSNSNMQMQQHQSMPYRMPNPAPQHALQHQQQLQQQQHQQNQNPPPSSFLIPQQKQQEENKDLDRHHHSLERDDLKANRDRSRSRERDQSSSSKRERKRSERSRRRDDNDDDEDMDEDHDDTTNIIPVLRILTALEDQLGSLGPKVIELLSKALHLEKVKPGKMEDELLTIDNCIFFETVREKLKGQLLTGVVDSTKIHAVKKAVKDVSILIKEINIKRKNEPPKPPEPPIISLSKSNVAGSTSSGGHSATASNTASSTATKSKSNPDKSEIAKKLAAILIAQGKKDFKNEDLEQLVTVYSLMENKSREGGNVSEKNKPLQKSLSDTLSAFIKPTGESKSDNKSDSYSYQSIYVGSSKKSIPSSTLPSSTVTSNQRQNQSQQQSKSLQQSNKTQSLQHSHHQQQQQQQQSNQYPQEQQQQFPQSNIFQQYQQFEQALNQNPNNSRNMNQYPQMFNSRPGYNDNSNSNYNNNGNYGQNYGPGPGVTMFNNPFNNSNRMLGNVGGNNHMIYPSDNMQQQRPNQQNTSMNWGGGGYGNRR